MAFSEYINFTKICDKTKHHYKKCIFIQFYDKLKSSFQSSEEFLAHFHLPHELILENFQKKKLQDFITKLQKTGKGNICG